MELLCTYILIPFSSTFRYNRIGPEFHQAVQESWGTGRGEVVIN